MALKPKHSPVEGQSLFEIEKEPLEECLTALAGVPPSVRAVRSDSLRRSCIRLLPEPLVPNPERACTSTVAWHRSLRGGGASHSTYPECAGPWNSAAQAGNRGFE